MCGRATGQTDILLRAMPPTQTGANNTPPEEELMPAPEMQAAAESAGSSARNATELIAAILQQSRLDALAACDANVVSYDPGSFLMIFRCRGRQMPFVIKPLLVLVMWGVVWALIFARFERVRLAMLPLEDLITPLLTPVSFLLVFRLARAAVRFWDARAAAGKLVEVCRTMASSALVACASQPELADGFARWICAYPIAVKNFLRPAARRGWQPETRLRKQRNELGALLTDAEAAELIHVGTNQSGGMAPITVLNHLRQLAFRASAELRVDAAVRAAIYRHLTEQIDTLTGAMGAMERINATPLPFAYVVHLRTFLVLYLLAWNLEALALHGWSAFPTLVLVSWALLGIEAAAVECERPFRWDANHLALGRMGVVVSQNVGQTLRGVVGEDTR
mmetsp:Transcript_5063/g.9880  ORF Transcript_5063/g.9880 Transcript_5063/m.9880 type:complete len:394 (+) Transcript_5063:55-1236(+)